MSTEKIIGVRAYSRLKKAGIDTDSKIAKLSPEKLMSIAGIGFKKSFKLYKSLNVKATEDNLKKIYNKIHKKTRFQRVKANISRFSKDPRETIDKIEENKKALVLYSNLLTDITNIGKGRADQPPKREGLVYAPTGLSIDPFSLATEYSSEQTILYGELTITKEDGKVKSQYEVVDKKKQEIVSQETEYVPAISNLEEVTAIEKSIRKQFKDFRTRDLNANFVVILDDEFNDIYQTIRDDFKIEIDRKNVSIIPGGRKAYYEWEAIFRYSNNKDFERMITLLDEFQAYYYYEEYEKEGGKEEFSDWKTNNEELEGNHFWKQLQAPKYSYSYLELETPLRPYKVYFGVLKGVVKPQEYEKSHQWHKVYESIIFPRDTGYDEYKESVNKNDSLEGMKVPLTALMLAESVLEGDITIYINKEDKEIIFESKKIPGIGILYQEVLQ